MAGTGEAICGRGGCMFSLLDAMGLSRTLETNPGSEGPSFHELAS